MSGVDCLYLSVAMRTSTYDEMESGLKSINPNHFILDTEWCMNDQNLSGSAILRASHSLSGALLSWLGLWKS